MLSFGLGSQVAVGTINANCNCAYFERAIADMALPEARNPGWLGRRLARPVRGLENYGK